MTTLYIAGPMAGYPEFNYPAFHEAAKRLRDKGYDVLNPAETILPEDDFEPIDLSDPSTVTAEHRHAFLRASLFQIIVEADGIATLTGWHNSPGAKVEVHVARSLGLPVLHLNAWLKAEP